MPADLFAGPEDETMAPETDQPAAPRPGADKPEQAAQDKPVAPVKTAKPKPTPPSAGGTPAPPAADAPGFEESYTRLESLVAELERGELPLESMLDKFEEGVKLVRNCQAFLKKAQLRVEQYVEQRDGRWVLKDLDAE